MLDQFSRTELLLGKEKIEKLSKTKVAVFGIGGVGSFVVEGLVRAGVGKFVLVDDEQTNTCNKKNNWKIQSRCDERKNIRNKSKC